MVKRTISITLDEKLLKKIKRVVESGESPFRSKSALIEYYLKKSRIDEYLPEPKISVLKPEKG